MKKLESTLKNMVLVLTGTAVVTGGLLAMSNETTKSAIATQAEKNKKTAVFEALNIKENTMKISEPITVQRDFGDGKTDFEVYQVTDTAGNDAGAAVKSTAGGFGGDLEIMVGFDADGKVTGYKLLKHSETPGLGAKAGEWFQKGQKGDITGKKAGNLTVTKDGGDIDAITASTITSRAFLKAVNQAYHAYKDGKTDEEKADGHTSASTAAKEKHSSTSSKTDVKTDGNTSDNVRPKAKLRRTVRSFGHLPDKRHNTGITSSSPHKN